MSLKYDPFFFLFPFLCREKSFILVPQPFEAVFDDFRIQTRLLVKNKIQILNQYKKLHSMKYFSSQLDDFHFLTYIQKLQSSKNQGGNGGLGISGFFGIARDCLGLLGISGF